LIPQGIGVAVFMAAQPFISSVYQLLSQPEIAQRRMVVRATAERGTSLMLAMRSRIRPCSSNSQFSLP
jgi:hypothetical protein